jgi:hypothetical protein
MRGVAALASAAALACWCATAQAYRPFDGTDAAVAAPGEMEIEFGAVEYLREGSERALFAPNVRLNYGFVPGWEAVLEGELAHGLTAGTSGTRLVGNGAFLKGMLREGSLQEKPGPSIATEFGILLPGIHDERGTGASVAGIVSQQLMPLRRSRGSSMPTSFSTSLSRVRTTGRCGRSPNSSTSAISASFRPARLWSGRSGK